MQLYLVKFKTDGHQATLYHIHPSNVTDFFLDHPPSLPSNSYCWSNGDCLEGRRENYQVCYVLYCVQQLCTVQWTDLAVVLSVRFSFSVVLHVLQSICVRFSFFWIILCDSLYVCVCSVVVLDLFITVLRDWLGRMSLKWLILCWVGLGCKTLTQSVWPTHCSDSSTACAQKALILSHGQVIYDFFLMCEPSS